MKRLPLSLLLLFGGLLAILALAAAPKSAEAATTAVQVGQVNGGTTSASRYNAASVSVAPGDTVRWQLFNGTHNVTSAVVPAGEATFRFPASGNMALGPNYDLVVNTAGTYTYYCSVHASASDATLANIDGNITGDSLMVGKVVVQAAGAAVAATVKVGQVNGGTTSASQYNAASVSVAPGDTVRWQWFNRTHNVTSAVVPAGEATFRFPASGNMVPGPNYDLVVNTAGTYTYYCSVHANASDATLANIDGNITGNSLMVGKVVVQAASSAVVANLVLPGVAYSHAAQSSSGTATLTATNGQGTGFSVTILASNFAYSGPNAGPPIPAANFSITLAGVPVMTTGQVIDATGGPKVPAANATGALDVARKTIQANAGFGVGTYTQALAVVLSIPGQTRSGAYTSTLTTTISAAP